jgi:hypothetical protein
LQHAGHSGLHATPTIIDSMSNSIRFSATLVAPATGKDAFGIVLLDLLASVPPRRRGKGGNC